MANDLVYSPFRKIARGLEPSQEIADNVPGNVLRSEVQILKIGEIGPEGSLVVFDGVVCCRQNSLSEAFQRTDPNKNPK